MPAEVNYLKQRYNQLGRPQLRAWGKLAEKHWRNHLPLLYKGLRETGALKPALAIAQETAADRYSQLVDQGTHPEAARELAMKEFLFLDPEEPEENLSEEESLNPLGDLANEQGASSAVINWLGNMKTAEEKRTTKLA